MSLEFRCASFGYSSRTVLDDVSFSLGAGEIVALLGANGCGKTTLFRTILGALPLRGGRMFLDGDPLDAIAAKERATALGYVPQTSMPTFPFRVVDVVAMGRKPHLGRFASPGGTERELARRSLERLDAGHLAERVVTELSGGERQRVLIARALAQGSRFLLLDEPTSHLDFGHAHQALALIRSLARSGIGVLWTTHAPDQVLHLADRVVVLGDGGVVAIGRPRDVLAPRLFERVFGIRAGVDDWTNAESRTRSLCLVEEDA